MRKIAFGIALLCLSSMTFAVETTTPTPISTPASAPNKADLKEGESIYKAHCSICHMSGVANAPKAHNQQDWDMRIQKATSEVKKQGPSLQGAQLEEKVMEYLVNSVKKGLGAMPAHGMCPTCTDKQYYDAISFMKNPEPEKK